ncbi:thiol:disulfide interchange protein DsbA/DsbL [Wenzhouxiangella limi]|uniref:Thiol:disulfide interchange protein n=1 Tax=Wenzhouxiangella limi TaxID=2707351 RepID=A0A845V3N7_9GAMM|nr:thiol:disulfide interchange protein DsbA/DsbL [Wenzhouxiangella limi]NDY95826.1 thiol:disulfide interchange protein DsbA/DsbL [Wenzhouxiangella limi]
MSRLNHITLFFGCLVWLGLSGSVAAQTFEEGTHFHAIGSPATPPSDRVEVVEAFAYPCPACRNFMPIIAEWATGLPDHVSLSHLPVGLQPGWEVFARAYYTADVLGLGQDAHEAMFRALHDERRQFRSIEDIAEVYTEFGVEVEEFVNTSQSFAVDGRMRRNRNDIMGFGVRGTPTMIVQGKWRLSPTDFNSYQELLAAVDYLIERESEALEQSGNGSADTQ